MNGRLMTLLLAWLIPLGFLNAASPAADISQAADTLWLRGVIDIDSSGRVERLELQSQALRGDVADMLQAQVSRWRFAPPSIEGQAGALRTAISLELGLLPEDSNPRARTLGILKHRLGDALWTEQPAPVYPSASLARGLGAELILIADVDGEGRVIAVEPVQGVLLGQRVRAEAVQRRALEPFVRAAIGSIQRWRMEPPHAAPAAKTTRFLVPIRFHAGQSPAGARAAEALRYPAADALGAELAPALAAMVRFEDGGANAPRLGPAPARLIQQAFE